MENIAFYTSVENILGKWFKKFRSKNGIKVV